MEYQNKMFFCNVIWMERYQGITKDDPVSNDDGKGDKDGNKYEVCNFSPRGEYCYGYVQPPNHGKRLDIGRIGTLDEFSEEIYEGKSISGVTVIWVATDPDPKIRGRRIVGWYKDATVFERRQPFEPDKPLSHSDSGYKIDGYWIRAHKEDCECLSSNQRRSHKVPKVPSCREKKGGMGRYIWYSDNRKNDREIGELVSETKKKVFQFIQEYENESLRGGNQGWGGTPEDKKKVEEAAITMCWNYFEDHKKYRLRSVEEDDLGWDLEATKPGVKLRIEVKGLSTPNPSIELTPNEYEKFNEYKSSYYLAVVVNALEDPKLPDRKLFICYYNEKHKHRLVDVIYYDKEHERWSVEDRIRLVMESTDDKGRERWVTDGDKKCTLNIKPKTSASIELKHK